MSSLESGSASFRGRRGGCSYRARIKPRQVCSCHGVRKQYHRNESGGIYDEPSADLPEDTA